jgi:hypothetical protein
MFDGVAVMNRHIPMKALQFPVVSNTATTGHKLQGATIESLFVHDWNYGFTNWPYVVLSRVTTMSGLWFRGPIRESIKCYALPQAYSAYLQSTLKPRQVQSLTAAQRAYLKNGHEPIREWDDL